MPKTENTLGRRFEQVSQAVTAWTGSTAGFGTAVLVIVVWAATGPIFGFSDTWQLIINTGTTIVTFLMVFLIQRSQNRDALAVHIKLNELVAAVKGASNRMIDVEALSEQELRVLERYYGELAALAREESNLAESCTIEQARRQHEEKQQYQQEAKEEK